jgi:mono/diheme cytochrome c family protein
MDEGTGDQFLGAPNLTDAIWLYGGSEEAIEYTVRNARFGVMPPWSADASDAGRLSEAEVRSVAVYVHSLGWRPVGPAPQGSGSPSRLPDRHRSRSCSRVRDRCLP